MSKTAMIDVNDSTDEPVEQLLDDGGEEFQELVQQRLNELLIEQIVNLRQKRGWTQATLAERAGVKQPFIAKLESGNSKNVELRTLVRIAAALDATLEIRITDEEREHVPARITPTPLLT